MTSRQAIAGLLALVAAIAVGAASEHGDGRRTSISFQNDDVTVLTVTVDIKTWAVSFQNGVGGYAGTVDIEIWAVAPNTCLEGNPNASADADNDGGESQILLRFDGIIGDKAGQIPPQSTIHSAKVVVSAFDEGNPVHLHRMLVPWKPTATWNGMIGGVTADGLEAAKKVDSFTFGTISASSSEVPFDVTDTVQAWASGDSNFGWVFINTGSNGWDFYTSEFEEVKQRPKLVVEFTPPRAKTSNP